MKVDKREIALIDHTLDLYGYSGNQFDKDTWSAFQIVFELGRNSRLKNRPGPKLKTHEDWWRILYVAYLRTKGFKIEKAFEVAEEHTKGEIKYKDFKNQWHSKCNPYRYEEFGYETNSDGNRIANLKFPLDDSIVSEIKFFEDYTGQSFHRYNV